MPFKANADRRHRIPKQRRRITNWAEYDAALRQRGSLTVWFTEAAIAAWHAEPRTTPGGQPHYSSLAIATALTFKAVFRLALRQTEGLIASVLQLLGLDLPVPDHSTLSRRAETLEVPQPKAGSAPMHLLVDSTGLKLCGPGEWLIEKHGTKVRRSWRKLHIGVDADTGRIVASELTTKNLYAKWVRVTGAVLRQSSVRVERGSPCWANAPHQHPEPGGSAFAFCPTSSPRPAGVTAGTPWLTSRSSSSRSKRSWRPWSASGSACTAAAANRT